MKERRAPAWPGPEKARTDSAGAQPDVRGMNESNCNARRGFNAKQFDNFSHNCGVTSNNLRK